MKGANRTMKIGLIDVDGHNFPNLPLMKLSAWHKQQGDSVEWYSHMFTGYCDRVYMSKVFTFTPDYPYQPYANEIVKSGTGYIYPKGGKPLPEEIEHTYPDYSLYGIADTAYGFLSRGCPRGCGFCIVGDKEGKTSQKVADLSEFWMGQKNIVLLDPNITACKDWESLFQQLIDSRAWIDFSQGMDIRVMTLEKAELLRQMKIKQIHFAWDNYEDKEMIISKFQEFKQITGWDKRKMGVYVLTNFNTTFEQDLERVYTLRELGYNPFIMIYNKDQVKKGADLKQLQQWVNSRRLFAAVERFEDYR